MLWLNSPRVGLDIGTRTVKAVQLKKSGGKVFVERFFFQDLAENNDYYPLSAPTDEVLAAAIQTNGFRKRAASICLDENEILTHEARLPKMPAKDLETALRGYIEEQFHLSGDEVCLDHIVLEEGKDDEDSSRLIKTYFAKTENVQKLVQLVRSAGLKPQVIDSGVLARVEMLRFNGYLKAKGNFLVVDIGESHITASLVSNDRVTLSNVIPTGFGAINKMFFETQGMPYDQAELLKLTYDMRAHETEANETEKQLDEALYEMFYKLQRMVDFFKVSLKRAPIESVLLTGGGSQMSHIQEAMETYCTVPAQVVNPLKNIEIYHSKNLDDARIASLAPYMGTAIGLALRGF
ncbi:MAG: pilus assembly protein PilM [Bdellovibrionaceae bacterium]|nr:pilus assembly protein PilM [Pseudobdellovibrionaceae bacterium]